MMKSKVLNRIHDISSQPKSGVRPFYKYSDSLIPTPRKGESMLSWYFNWAWNYKLTLRDFLKTEREFWIGRGDLLRVSIEDFNILWSRAFHFDLNRINYKRIPFLNKILLMRGLCTNSFIKLRYDQWLDTKIIETDSILFSRGLNSSLKFCPLCWKDDELRYFRIHWHLGFINFCSIHGIELIKICQSCGKSAFNTKDKSMKYLNSFSKCLYCGSRLGRKITPNEDIANKQRHLEYLFSTNSNWTDYEAKKLFIDSVPNYSKIKDIETPESYLDKLIRILLKFNPKNEKVLCYNCLKVLKSKESVYYGHILSCQKVLKCDICGMEDFANSNSYYEHVFICKNRPICKICGKKEFKIRKDYHFHIKSCKGSIHCKKCSRNTFQTISGYYSHLKMCNKTRSCLICGRKKFNGNSDFKTHKLNCLMKEKCKFCDKIGFVHNSTYKLHIEMCKKKFERLNIKKLKRKRLSKKISSKVRKRDLTILEILQEKGTMTRSQINEFVRVSRTTIFESLDRLISENKVYCYSIKSKIRGRPKTFYHSYNS